MFGGKRQEVQAVVTQSSEKTKLSILDRALDGIANLTMSSKAREEFLRPEVNDFRSALRALDNSRK